MSIELMLEETRSRRAAMWRGARGQCPACGTKSLFAKYLKVRDICPSCGLHLGGHQADDAPPYFTIFIVRFTPERPIQETTTRYSPHT